MCEVKMHNIIDKEISEDKCENEFIIYSQCLSWVCKLKL